MVHTTYHTTLKTTPFLVVYGREPPAILWFEQGSTNNGDLETLLTERDAMLVSIKEHLVRAQQLMKNKSDKKRRDVTLVMG